MEIGLGDLHFGDDALADDEITKALVFATLCHPQLDQLIQLFNHLIGADVLTVKLGHAGADAIAAHVEIVFARALADEADLGQHRAAAAIGAAHDAQDHVILRHTMLGQQAFHLMHQIGQEPLRLGHRQRACGQGHAGHGVLQLRGLEIVDQPVIAGNLFDLLALVRGHPGNHQILVRRHAEIALVDLRDLAQTRLQRTVWIIQNAAAEQVERQVMLAIDALDPAEPVAARGKLVGARRLELDPCPAFDFGFEDINTNAVERVFGLGILPVHPVAPIPLHGHNMLSHGQRVLQRDKAKVISFARIGRGVAMGHGQATAHKHVPAHQLAIFGDGHEVQVIGVHIHLIVWRNADRGFELARQVGLTKDRLLSGFHLLPIEPDLCVSLGLGQQMLRDLLGPFIGFRVKL